MIVPLGNNEGDIFPNNVNDNVKGKELDIILTAYFLKYSEISQRMILISSLTDFSQFYCGDLANFTTPYRGSKIKVVNGKNCAPKVPILQAVLLFRMHL